MATTRMTHRELLQALLDGKKLTVEGSWGDGEYIQMDSSGKLRDEDNVPHPLSVLGEWCGWQICEEPKLDFAEALERVMEGYRAVAPCVAPGTYLQLDSRGCVVWGDGSLLSCINLQRFINSGKVWSVCRGD